MLESASPLRPFFDKRVGSASETVFQSEGGYPLFRKDWAWEIARHGESPSSLYMFAYPGTDFFANVKVERLPAAPYPKLKQILIDNFTYMLATSPSFRINKSSGTFLRALDMRGIDRYKLEGGSLGVYPIFDDRKQVVTTIYLLNQEPQARKFQTLAEFSRLLDQFLSRYASCIAGKP